MSTVTTNFIDRALEKTIMILSGEYYKLQGFLVKTTVSDNDYVSHETYPVVGTDMMVVDDFVANDLGIDDIDSRIVGHSGETVHITESGIAQAIHEVGCSYHHHVGELLWNALNHGIKFNLEKKIDKHHKELFRKFERFFNNRIADWKNLPYC